MRSSDRDTSGLRTFWRCYRHPRDPSRLVLHPGPDRTRTRDPQGWIEATVFGSYLVPGLYLIAINGVAMFAAAALSVRRHWSAPWLTGALGVGFII